MAASANEDAVDANTSHIAMGSSFRTLVISKCWLNDGMSMSELLVFKE